MRCIIVNLSKPGDNKFRSFDEIPVLGQVLNFLTQDRKFVESYFVRRVERNFVEGDEVDVVLFCSVSTVPVDKLGFPGLVNHMY